MSPYVPPGGARVQHLENKAFGFLLKGQMASCSAGLENPIGCHAEENNTCVFLL